MRAIYKPINIKFVWNKCPSFDAHSASNLGASGGPVIFFTPKKISFSWQTDRRTDTWTDGRIDRLVLRHLECKHARKLAMLPKM